MDNPTEPDAIWERQAGETDLWFARFEAFRLLEHRRSVLAVYNAERAKQYPNKPKSKSCPKSWETACKRWDWRKRAAAWDEAKRTEERRLHEAERVKRRQRRAELLEEGFNKLAESLPMVDASESNLGQLAQLIKALYEQERAEFGDTPADRAKETDGGNGQIIFNIMVNRTPSRSESANAPD